MERIAPHVAARRVEHEEVAGHPDAVHVDAEPAADRDHQHRQRDRDAEAAFDHRVEERVLGIVVVIEVAREALALEEVDARNASNVGVRAARRERVEAREPRVDVEARVRVRGDAERGDVERHVGGGAVDRRDESLARVHRGRR